MNKKMCCSIIPQNSNHDVVGSCNATIVRYQYKKENQLVSCMMNFVNLPLKEYALICIQHFKWQNICLSLTNLTITSSTILHH